MQIVESRLDIDEKESCVAEPQKLGINCWRHVAVITAVWPCSTLSPSISYYNHANCGQITDLTYWYYIIVQGASYIVLFESSSMAHYALCLKILQTYIIRE